MPRLVRRQTFTERVLSFLNPLDHLLHIFTFFEGYDWDSVQNSTSTPLGLVLNLFLFVSRVNSSSQRYSAYDDVLRRPGAKYYGGDRGYTSGGLGYFVCTQDPKSSSAAACAPVADLPGDPYGFDGSYLWQQLWLVSWCLAGLSVLNALICFTKNKKYRMFESNIDVEPSTPSARRVRLDSSPSSRSPLKFLSSILQSETPESRAHPNQHTDVWEISVWDPSKLSLRLFGLFSPAHVAIYFLVFPIHHSTFGSSTTSTYVTVLIVQVLLSIQLLKLQDFFTQQSKDISVINKEVFREYDTKFVHPRLNTVKRDVATQCADDHFEASVDIFTPQFNRMGFKTMANQNYASYTSAASTYSGVGTPPSGFYHHKLGSAVPSSEYNTPINNRASLGGGRNLFGPRRPEATNTNTLNDPFAIKIKKEPGTTSSSRSTSSNVFNRAPTPVQRPSNRFSSAGNTAVAVNPYTTHSGVSYTSTGAGSFSSSDEVGDDDHDAEEEIIRTHPPSTSSLHRRPRRDTIAPSSNENNSYPPQRSAAGMGTGMAGLVNMSMENSRNLTPSKMTSPLKRGGRARGSTYAASLGGGVFGTPRR